MVKNILVRVGYDGSAFHGWQANEGLRSVEGEIKKAVHEVTGEDNRIIGAGRTDRGVHAMGQVFNFLTATDIAPAAFKYKLEASLPDDIIVYESKEVAEGFHSRFSAKDKTYKYVVSRSKNLHPIYRNYVASYTYKLDLDILAKGLDCLVGDHDFVNFCVRDKTGEINTQRNIERAYFEEQDDRLIFTFKAPSFLHKQVRTMVGASLDLARGRVSMDYFGTYLDSSSGHKANPVMGPEGLYLCEVRYD